jgi:hypothetical protein
VKWLASVTTGGLVPLGNGTGGMPVVSRVLGGLQFATSPTFNPKSIARAGCPYLPCLTNADECAAAPPSSACTSTISAEQALLNVLEVYFSGTSAGTSPPGTTCPNNDPPTSFASTVCNNGTQVTGAPLSYLQVWNNDIDYAAGWGNCSIADIMKNTKCAKFVSPSLMPTVPFNGTNYTAQGLLSLAAANIPTTKPVALPLFGYNNGSNQVCGCKSPTYTQRGAFDGDFVCVEAGPTGQATITQNENAAAQVPPPPAPAPLPPYYPLLNANGTNYTPINPPVVPYGICQAGYGWRQAHMGDYVCVSLTEQMQVASDNVMAASRIECPAPP